MAGTNDQNFYANMQNSPFWQKVSESQPLTDSELLQEWKRKFGTKQSANSEVCENKYSVVSSGIMRLITDNILCHPFLVLRRQCQVNVFAKKYHTVPLTLIPVIIRLHQRQGLTVLWKGIGSALIVKGLTLAVEDFLTKITTWPKEINRHSSLKAIGHHILLKSISLAIVVPFYAASVVETVQSEVASEKPGIFDVFQEGFHRLLSWSPPQTGRLLPIWIIIIPTVLCGTLHYITSVLSTGLTRWSLLSAKKRIQKKQGAVPKEMSSMELNEIEMTSRFLGNIAADVIFFPFETVLNRLHIQGTRTIIDNLDTGSSVIPILTRYDGFFDCWSTVVRGEGRWGLYKGFGSLIFQYVVQLAFIKGSLFTLSHMGPILKPNRVVMPTVVNKTVLQTNDPSNVLYNRDFTVHPVDTYGRYGQGL